MAGGAVDNGRIGDVFAVVCKVLVSEFNEVKRGVGDSRINTVQMLMKAKRAM